VVKISEFEGFALIGLVFPP